ncbi:MAG: hypothetical protein ABS95_03120 [Verrucomicrobia bacterium SCN 57-15]|jgi:flagellar basal body-associated protein FliL|nr:MAG: hypothetical protein ABS95_03120 [Verrucomicrobia bacterium SCN 57-15]
MKLKLILLIAVLAVSAVAITFITIRVLDQRKENEARPNVQTATTNMMQELKPITSPPIFPEK